MRQRAGRGAGVERLVVTRNRLSLFTETGRSFVSARSWVPCYRDLEDVVKGTPRLVPGT